jgi:hypothetical protein
MYFKSFFTIAVLSCTLLAYQNCARAQFNSVAGDGANQQFEDPTDGIDPSVPGDEDDGIDPNVPPNTTPTPKPSPTPKKDDPSSCDKDDVVECEMVSPNAKIILGQTSKLLELGSNSSATRVCMSERACLKLINSYAAGRKCSLSLHACSSNSQTQCTKIFPGSQGTCKNAKVLSDAEVAKLLEKMGK